MELTTYEDYATLASWSFLTFQQQRRSALVELARRTYTTFRQHSGDPWLRAERTAEALTLALQGAMIFIRICEDKEKQGANPMLREIFARALARYIIDQDWPVIAGLTL